MQQWSEFDGELEVRQLRAFVALIDQGSVTAAARVLKHAQSTVSEALAALERTLGTTVIRRRRGSHDAVLTAAGETLLPNARAVLAAVDRTHMAIAKATCEARGVVDIVANESVSTYVLSKVLACFRPRWPNTRFSVSIATCTEIRQGIVGGKFDVGFLLESAEDTANRDRTENACGWEDYQVVASAVPLAIFSAPTHPLARPERQNLAISDLAGFAVYISDPAGEFHALVHRFMLKDGLPAARLHSAGSTGGVKASVIADPDALGILPLYAVADELRGRRFLRLRLSPGPPLMRLIALHSRVRDRHPGATELVQDVKLFAARVQPETIPSAGSTR
jgi:DNA-binding transcriptional LysR family regulator